MGSAAAMLAGPAEALPEGRPSSTTPAFGFVAELDVWVSGHRVAVSGPVGEMLLTGAATAELATCLGAEGALGEAAVLQGSDGLRRAAALGRLRRLRIVEPMPAHPTASPAAAPARLPRTGLALHPATARDDGTRPLLLTLEGDPATSLAALAERLGAGATWLPLRLEGPMPWAGPMFGPAAGEPGPCPACLVLRLRGATEIARSARADPTARQVHAGRPRPRPDRVAALLAELDDLLADDPALLRTTMLTAWRGTVSRGAAVSGACGCAAQPALAGLPLAERVARLCDRLTGPVPLLVELGTPQDPLRVASASQSPVARWAGLPPPSLAALAAVARDNSLSGGCGPDAAAARFRAAMEGIENYAALWRGADDGIAQRAAFDDLPPGAAIPPQALLGFGVAQQAADAAVAAAIDPAAPRAWCAATELDAVGRAIGSVLLPHALVFDGALPPGPVKWESNGLAAGPTDAAAKAHALAELVERDAVAIWWHNALPRPRLPLPAGDAIADAAIASHRRRGRAIALLDLTHDLGVPARAALTWDAQTGGAIVMGFAADPDPARADRRALAESCQRLPALDHWRTAGRRGARGRLPEWFARRTLADLPWLLAGPDAPAPAPKPVGSEERLAAVLQAIVGAGLRPLVVDLLRADVGIPVVKAFVPGLRHVRNRFGPGRLFDVPVRLRWLAAPRAETDMLAYPDGLW